MNWLKKLFQYMHECYQDDSKEEAIYVELTQKILDRRLLVDFAGDALKGLIAGKDVTIHDYEYYATRAFELADHMVKVSKRWLK